MEKINETKLSNRRRSRRAAARTSVKVQCRKGALGLGPNIGNKMLDISDSGLRMIIAQPVDLMAEVEIVIDGYGMKERIKRVGNIRWQVKMDDGQFLVGIGFQKCLNYRDWQIIAAPN